MRFTSNEMSERVNFKVHQSLANLVPSRQTRRVPDKTELGLFLRNRREAL